MTKITPSISGGGVSATAIIVCTPMDDVLIGTNGDDSFQGLDGNDSLIGGLGVDSYDGGLGTDRAQYSNFSSSFTINLLNSANNTGDADGETYVSIENLFGSSGDNMIFGDNNNNTLWGFAGTNTLFGRGGDDILNGGTGNDFLVGGSGVDSYNGGAGIDRVQYNSSSTGMRIDLANQASNTGDAAGETYIGVENVLGSSGDDMIFVITHPLAARARS